jgi:hypothetical protein
MWLCAPEIPAFFPFMNGIHACHHNYERQEPDTGTSAAPGFAHRMESNK